MKAKIRPWDILAVVVACLAYVAVPFLLTTGTPRERRNAHNVVVDLDLSLATNHTREDVADEILKILKAAVEQAGAYFPPEWENLDGKELTDLRFVASFPQEEDAREYEGLLRQILSTLEEELRQSEFIHSA